MTLIKVFHNPTAGEAEHSKEKLVNLIQASGFNCSYSSTKKPIDEKRIPAKTKYLAVAGGDGSIRKLAEYFCKGPMLKKRHSIGLIPWGTANNIAATIGVKGTAHEIIENWKNGKTLNFDVGKIIGLKENHFFLEACGFGVFPRLIKRMRDRDKKSSDPEAELKTALEKFHQIIQDYKPKKCHLLIDGVDYSGSYLMVEIMNIRSIGPNLNISPMGSPSDGEFDIILVSDGQREELSNYVLDRMDQGKQTPFFYMALKAKKLEVTWEGRMMHVDDELVDLPTTKKLEVDVLRDVLSFLV